MRSPLFVGLLYLFIGIYVIGRIWSRISIRSIGFVRTLTPRVLLGEDVWVRLEVYNRGILPVAWLRVEEALPLTLSKAAFKRVVTLSPFGKTTFEYQLHTNKRGLYTVGPLKVYGGDLFGISSQQSLSGGEQTLVVYPRIYQLPGLRLLSRSPMGNLRTTQPIFEDPTRIRSKRDYVSGDSLRRIDWKASASSRRLQVKQFEPSIALETMIFLNLNADEYDSRTYYDSTELAIIVCASIANWLSVNQQAIGLATNGLDPVGSLDAILPDQVRIEPSTYSVQNNKPEPSSTNETSPDSERSPLTPFQPVTPKKGQLLLILDILARIQPASLDLLSRKFEGETRRDQVKQQRPQPFLEIIHHNQGKLSWGTTLVLITGQAGDDLFNTIFSLRRQGLLVIVVLVGQITHLQHTRELARYFHIPLFHFRNEMDLIQQNDLVH